MNNPIQYDLEKVAKMLRHLPRKVAVVAENFSKERFREQGWKDTSWQPWRKRRGDKASDQGRAILVKSGALRRSIKATARGMSVIVSTHLPYAEAHNEGFNGTVSETVGSHSRKSHKRKGYTRSDGRKFEAVQVKEHTIGSFTRKRNINLPARRFIGQSTVLDKEVTALISADIDKAFK